MHQMRPVWRLICPSTRVVTYMCSGRFRCCIRRRRQSTRCSRDGVTSKCAAAAESKILALPISAITRAVNDVQISVGQEPIPVPRPFADMLTNHMLSRANLRTTGGSGSQPVAIPDCPTRSASQPQSIMTRLRGLGIDLLGARNTALPSLVLAAPPPLVAELLGYSYNAPSGTLTSQPSRGRGT